jgi:chemotaxis protein MotB
MSAIPQNNDKPPIIVKQVKKARCPHHGGAWKVAYADFVTAMMAFFLLMWILEVTTPEQKSGLAAYFQSAGIAQDVSSSIIDLNTGGDSLPQQIFPETIPQSLSELESEPAPFDVLMSQLQEDIRSDPMLSPYQDQLLIDITEQGLRIQLVDRDNRPLFALGNADLHSYARQLLEQLAIRLSAFNYRLSIAGHTDAMPYNGSNKGYGNWELSSDRANAARRQMVAAGFPARLIARVEGLADTQPLDPVTAFSPVNRRISVLLLNQASEHALDSSN